ncbi:MAG: hypothetical protein M1840_007158 [Geoglossum simile]|nr:MAG: hypothetical protein M1840_007158 [Geoglossum simile]
MASPTRPPYLAPDATRKDALDKSSLSEQQRKSLSRDIMDIIVELNGETKAQIFGRSIGARLAFRAFVKRVVVDTGLGVKYWGQEKGAGLVWRTGVEYEDRGDNNKITSIVGMLIRRSISNRKRTMKAREGRAKDRESRREANSVVLEETAEPSPFRYPSLALELTREPSSVEQPLFPTRFPASSKNPLDHLAFLEALRRRISNLSSFLASSSTHHREISHHKNSIQCDLDAVTAKLTLEQEASSQARCELNKSFAEVERLTKMLSKMEEENGRLRRCISSLGSTIGDITPNHS